MVTPPADTLAGGEGVSLDVAEAGHDWHDKEDSYSMSRGSTRTNKAAAIEVARAAGGPGRLGDGVGQAAPMTLGQRIANDLNAAEQSLAEAENRYIGAKHGWAEEMRRRGHGDGTEADVAKAQTVLTAADEARHQVGERIEELRRRLYDQRRREILAEAVTGQFAAHEEALRRLAEAGKRQSLLRRIFRR
ncbi:MAG: hypothetical protein M3R05_05765 [Chloroflexota bacterium]|nr:hypothetical protein [Chloroflexota bacterium]